MQANSTFDIGSDSNADYALSSVREDVGSPAVLLFRHIPSASGPGSSPG